MKVAGLVPEAWLFQDPIISGWEVLQINVVSACGHAGVPPRGTLTGQLMRDVFTEARVLRFELEPES